jgi:hypothetical protein
MSAVSGIPTRYLYDSTDSLLRFAMRADAIVSGLCGLAIAFFADPLSSQTGLTPAVEYSLGVFLVLYGLFVQSLAALPDLRNAGMGVVGANTAFTVGALGGAVALPLTASGVIASMFSALYTTAFAALQYLGVRRLATA